MLRKRLYVELELPTFRTFSKHFQESRCFDIECKKMETYFGHIVLMKTYSTFRISVQVDWYVLTPDI